MKIYSSNFVFFLGRRNAARRRRSTSEGQQGTEKWFHHQQGHQISIIKLLIAVMILCENLFHFRWRQSSWNRCGSDWRIMNNLCKHRGSITMVSRVKNKCKNKQTVPSTKSPSGESRRGSSRKIFLRLKLNENQDLSL